MQSMVIDFIPVCVCVSIHTCMYRHTPIIQLWLELVEITLLALQWPQGIEANTAALSRGRLN